MTTKYVYVAMLREDGQTFCLGSFSTYNDALAERPDLPLGSSMGGLEWFEEEKDHMWGAYFVNCIGNKTGHSEKEFQILITKLDRSKRVEVYV